MKFILPKLLGVTVLVGIAMFILSMIFKLLFAVLVLAGIGTFVAKMIGKKRERQMGYGNGKREFLPYYNNVPKPQEAVYSQTRKENLAIIPIQ
ncbi:hypothetical protein [Chryseobacterium jejuense]|uniref:hypothetical protein n=1 Tax=Chryseobacterium jejuense TaxID=445960 RepID=UPI001AEA10D8|nr:hypothetical protein [Chryseobacterium jejuense]MBP2618248.1 hypothetical protein [Chryseobacterium jejuense]